MPKKLLAATLTAFLAGACYGKPRQPSPAEQLHAIPRDAPVEVRLLNGSKLRGWVTEVGDRQFVLSHESKHQLSKSQFAFDQVRSVKQVKSVKATHTVRNILIGVGIGIAAFIGIAVAYYAAHGPLG